MDDGERLTRSHPGAHRRLDHNARGMVDTVFLLRAAHPKLEPGQPDLQGVDRFHVAFGGSEHRELNRGHWQALVELAALRGEHAQEGLAPGA